MPGDPLAEIHSGDVLLHDVVQAVAVSHFVDLHDVGMDQRRGRPRFPLEALQIGMVLGEGGLEDLHGHAPLQLALFGQVDLGHGPAAQPPQQPQIAQLPAGKIGGRGRVGRASVRHHSWAWNAAGARRAKEIGQRLSLTDRAVVVEAVAGAPRDCPGPNPRSAVRRGRVLASRRDSGRARSDGAVRVMPGLAGMSGKASS